MASPAAPVSRVTPPRCVEPGPGWLLLLPRQPPRGQLGHPRSVAVSGGSVAVSGVQTSYLRLVALRASVPRGPRGSCQTPYNLTLKAQRVVPAAFCHVGVSKAHSDSRRRRSSCALSAGNVAAGLETSDHTGRAKNTGSESQTSVHTTAR